MDADTFLKLLSLEAKSFKSILETEDNEWIVKGFIDTDRSIYTITNDTKVVSKVIEIILIPYLASFATRYGLTISLPSKQNYYPDLTFADETGNKFAVDFKSSYYDGSKVNGLTLGSYWGYFRERNVRKSMDYPYSEYKSHIVLGILYRQNPYIENEKIKFSLDELDEIHSVIKDFKFFVQPKWRIASDCPGSGNTRNIGGITDLEDLISGNGPFTKYADGEKVFDSYWIGYYNVQDAKQKGLGAPPYNNLITFKKYLQEQNVLLKCMEDSE